MTSILAAFRNAQHVQKTGYLDAKTAANCKLYVNPKKKGDVAFRLRGGLSALTPSARRQRKLGVDVFRERMNTSLGLAADAALAGLDGRRSVSLGQALTLTEETISAKLDAAYDLYNDATYGLPVQLKFEIASSVLDVLKDCHDLSEHGAWRQQVADEVAKVIDKSLGRARGAVLVPLQRAKQKFAEAPQALVLKFMESEGGQGLQKLAQSHHFSPAHSTFLLARLNAMMAKDSSLDSSAIEQEVVALSVARPVKEKVKAAKARLGSESQALKLTGDDWRLASAQVRAEFEKSPGASPVDVAAGVLRSIKVEKVRVAMWATCTNWIQGLPRDVKAAVNHVLNEALQDLEKNFDDGQWEEQLVIAIGEKVIRPVVLTLDDQDPKKRALLKLSFRMMASIGPRHAAPAA